MVQNIFIKGCELCEIARAIPEGEICVVKTCRSCGVPMCVFKWHREPTEEEQRRMVKLMSERHPQARLDFARRSIPSHPHFHAR